MRFSAVLLLYRIAWEPALLLGRAAAALERARGGNLWPPRWQIEDRLADRPGTVADQGNVQVTRNPNVTQDRGRAGKASRTVWMHAASLGECKGLWAVARALAADLPAVDFVLTANTVEGRDFMAARATESPRRWTVRLAPLDHPRVVRAFLREYDVRALALFEVELWPHFAREARRARLPVWWISARLDLSGPGAARRYRIFSGAVRAVLGGIDWTLAQTQADASALRRAGANAVETGADLRGLFYLAGQAAQPPVPGTAPRAGIALVSLHAEELGAIAPALSLLPPDVPLCVFPRKLDSLPVFRAALEPLGFALHSENPGAARRVIDAFGLVEETLAHCRAALIGGSFAPHGGHNLWEPLKAGVSMLIGPRFESQRYLVDKLAAAGLLEISAGVPDLNALYARPVPDAACRLFVEAENRLLSASLEILRTRLAALAE